MTKHDPMLMKRRSFLKGLFAAGAAPVIAPELLTSAVLAADTSAIPTHAPSLPKTAAYELWLRNSRKWEMVGMVRALTVERPVVEVPDFGWTMYRGFEPGPEQFISMDVLQDTSGMETTRSLMQDGGEKEMIFATPMGKFRSSIVATHADWEISDKGISASLHAMLVGEVIHFA